MLGRVESGASAIGLAKFRLVILRCVAGSLKPAGGPAPLLVPSVAEPQYTQRRGLPEQCGEKRKRARNALRLQWKAEPTSKRLGVAAMSIARLRLGGKRMHAGAARTTGREGKVLQGGFLPCGECSPRLLPQPRNENCGASQS